MFKSERQQEILNIISEKNFVSVKELCKLLYSSEASIRRDLTLLENQGKVIRSYGGAKLNINNSQLPPFSARIHHKVKEKKIIAKKAAALIEDKSIIFLDQSSSSLFLANELQARKGITVFTNSLEILSVLSVSGLDVYSSGGIISKNNPICLVGYDAEKTFSSVHADWFFFSAKAITEGGDIYDCNRDEVHVRKSMLRNSARQVCLCDTEKISSVSAYKLCSVDDITHIITEESNLKLGKKFNNINLL